MKKNSTTFTFFDRKNIDPDLISLNSLSSTKLKNNQVLEALENISLNLDILNDIQSDFSFFKIKCFGIIYSLKIYHKKFKGLRKKLKKIMLLSGVGYKRIFFNKDKDYSNNIFSKNGFDTNIIHSNSFNPYANMKGFFDKEDNYFESIGSSLCKEFITIDYTPRIESKFRTIEDQKKIEMTFLKVRDFSNHLSFNNGVFNESK